MSQPRSGCNTWLDELIKFNSTLPPSEDGTSQPPDSHHASEQGENSYHEQEEYFNRGGNWGTDCEAEVTNYFPEPPLAFEEGYTFLSLFDADEKSVHRKTNLYYPFSSQREWEIASWLLCLGLSMGKIDSFLLLEMGNMLGTCSRSYLVVQLSSDKMCITALIGDHVAYLLLISLTNIHMNTRLKSSLNTFLLTALLPVPKFVHRKKQMKGVLQDWLVHQCLDVVLEPLKLAARLGIMMSDPIGHSHYCFTPLASYIADTPEAMMLTCVGGKTSPVTMAMYKQFGDAFRHEPRTKSTTLAQLDVVHSHADPHNLEAFFHEAQKFRLNGIEKPFWSDWPLAEPSCFFTPESLHHIHKQFYNHDVQWITSTVGDSKLDFWFSILQPTTGYRHFHGGISKLKQVTSLCHRDIQ
ncbi:hypothetical protein DEU56DRAFT_908940 [Suillus clintonianus]|uniref:uncharacterized protein n=1 Tax=Suillus clintonianus TaxID=1904413 RepID=UPI001B86E1D7|nr:uncharacterized protein DEU56DRAFT_908940 [Suillus clintonianus]KAG2149241.1 hypothetical protein DEU56DRAFT_908940 [Suillus clintonianus]